MGGFFAKVLVFLAAVESGLVWLAVVGVLNAVVGLYYYLVVLKVVYLYRQEGDEVHLPVSRSQGIALAVCVIGVVVMGTVLAPWFSWTSAVAGTLF
jgi:NADH-quinone oxidoreductase subunit N